MVKMDKTKTLEEWEKTKGINNIIKHLMLNKEASFSEIKEIAGYKGSGDDIFLVQLSRSKATQSANKHGFKPLLVNKPRRNNGSYSNRIYSINPNWLIKELFNKKDLYTIFIGSEADYFMKYGDIIMKLYWDTVYKWDKKAEYYSINGLFAEFIEGLKILATIYRFNNKMLKKECKEPYNNKLFYDFISDLSLQRNYIANEYMIYSVFEGMPHPEE